MNDSLALRGLVWVGFVRDTSWVPLYYQLRYVYLHSVLLVCLEYFWSS